MWTGPGWPPTPLTARLWSGRSAVAGTACAFLPPGWRPIPLSSATFSFIRQWPRGASSCLAPQHQPQRTTGGRSRDQPGGALPGTPTPDGRKGAASSPPGTTPSRPCSRTRGACSTSRRRTSRSSFTTYWSRRQERLALGRGRTLVGYPRHGDMGETGRVGSGALTAPTPMDHTLVVSGLVPAEGLGFFATAPAHAGPLGRRDERGRPLGGGSQHAALTGWVAAAGTRA